MALSADALVTLAEAKVYLKITSGTEHDAVLEVLINSVSRWAREYMGRNLVTPAAAYVEYYHGNGARDLILRNRPILTVSSIYEDALRVWAADTLVSLSADIMQNKDAGALICWNNKSFWSPGTANIKVTYTAGYAVADVPADVKLAIYRTVDKHWRDGFTHRRLDVSSQSVGEQNTTYSGPQFSKDVLDILARYRSLLPAPQFSHAD